MTASRKPVVSVSWLDKWRRLHRRAGGLWTDDVAMTIVARAIDLLQRERASSYSAAAITSREYPDPDLPMAPEPVTRKRNRVRRR
jgi:hypothetical protein